MGLKDVVKKAAFVDILRGMSVTGTYFVVNKVTVEYPKEKLQTYPRFRGAHALLSHPETGETKCVACMLCATICPSQCIAIEGETVTDGRSRPKTFELDLARCIFCGFCEEVCPVAAIVMTRQYELSTFDKSDFLLTKDKLTANAVYVHKEVLAHAAPIAVAGTPGAAADSLGLVAGAADRPETDALADTPRVAAGAAEAAHDQDEES